MGAETLYAAFLRAVNVGGTGALAMKDLRALVEGIGGRDPQTWIASGNAVFAHSGTADEVRSRLEEALRRHPGKPLCVVTRTGDDLDATLAAMPFPHAAPNRVAILLTWDVLPEDPQATARGRQNDEIRSAPGMLYIHYPDGVGSSKLSLPAMTTGTLRNLNAVTKLRDMLAARRLA